MAQSYIPLNQTDSRTLSNAYISGGILAFMYKLLNAGQPSNTESLILLIVFGNLTVDNRGHSPKQSRGKELTPPCISTETKEVQA